MKKKIAIASILKPVDDTRMYEKMGVSLADTGQYKVFIIGYPSERINAYTNICFYYSKRFSRVSLRRLGAPFRVLRKVIQIKPDLLIINTHELLLIGTIAQVLFGTRIIYDIRENYYRNIRYSTAFSPGIKLFVAYWVRFKEKMMAFFFTHFLLAEKAYSMEMDFFGHNYTLIENKSVPPKKVGQREAATNAINLLFTGTIATSTGIVEAIALANALHNIEPRVMLTIIGSCAIKSTAHNIQRTIENKTHIRWVGSKHPVSHQSILKAIDEAHFGIVYYPPSPHTENAMPTKLYEYAAQRLPILTWENQKFSPWVINHQAGLIVSKPYKQLLNAMQRGNFYSLPIHGIQWEHTKFCALVEKMLQ